MTTEDLFPGADAGSAADLSALYGDDEALGFRGRAVQTDLLDADSEQGAAFQTLYGSFDLCDADLRNDPVWWQTDPLVADMTGVTADGGAVVTSCGHGCVQVGYDDRGSGHRPSCATCRHCSSASASPSRTGSNAFG